MTVFRPNSGIKITIVPVIGIMVIFCHFLVSIVTKIKTVSGHRHACVRRLQSFHPSTLEPHKHFFDAVSLLLECLPRCLAPCIEVRILPFDSVNDELREYRGRRINLLRVFQQLIDLFALLAIKRALRSFSAF